MYSPEREWTVVGVRVGDRVVPVAAFEEVHGTCLSDAEDAWQLSVLGTDGVSAMERAVQALQHLVSWDEEQEAELEDELP